MPKKRIIISIILTIVVIVSTISYWIIYRPLTFSMDIRSLDSNTITVTTVLNRKDEPSFSKSYEDGAKVTQETKKYRLSFKHTTSPKRLRFIFRDTTPNTEYKISNITFRDGKYPVDDLTKFNSDDAKLIIEDNSLIVIPNSNSATVDYSDRIKAKPAVKFDLKIFLIITILSYLLIYKLTSFLADFKINRNVSRLDIVFLAACTLLLFIPMVNINHGDISQKENRTLAKYIPLFNNDKSVNLNFGKDYESWISDRFGMRDVLIDVYRSFKGNLAIRYYITDRAYWDKKTNWMFNRNLLNPAPLTENQIEEISTALTDFNTFCKNNNIRLYVLISPRSENVYVQRTYLGKDYLDSYGDSIDKIRQKTEIPVVYPFDELIEGSKKDMVFFKTDHHWTDWGAYIGYKALMKEIKKDYPNIKEVDIGEFNLSQNNLARWNFARKYDVGCTYNLFNLPDRYKNKILDTQYNYFTHKDSELLKTDVVDISKLKEKHYEYPHGTNLKVFLIGSSPSENLTEILPYSFKETLFIRINKPKDIPESDVYKLIKLYRQIILDYSPDIMVLCIQVHTISQLKDLTKED